GTRGDVAMAQLEDLTAEVASLRRIFESSGLAIAQRSLLNSTGIIQGIVPVISSDADIPADRYYVHMGAGLSPAWISAATVNIDTGLWDSTEQQFYARMSDSGTAGGFAGSSRFAWPTGAFGVADTFAPKSADAV